MDRFVCIHGHFYQPPRENPWLEAVELQDSAYPYHDWNERITAECYGPNGKSRMLDGEGKIVNIVNNYSSISFNFGPTLLTWLQAHSPEVYESILVADRESRERFSGHGAALAQCYNHIIMPLANDRDKRTQIYWGIRDFEMRFGRSPEGMWLPETAVDLKTLELLVEHGIRFTILSPYQAGQVRYNDNGDWTDARDGRIDPSTVYRQVLPSGKNIAIFFYDGPISRAVAFEKLLERGEYLANRLLSAFRDQREWPQLVHIATDGESYGHHHPHGDMALSYALREIDKNPTVRLTIYGEFLEKFPPTSDVRIVENTSWSCCHGVERWRSNCGCNSGRRDWHQEWRAPLREALDWLRDSVAPLFEKKASNYLKDPWHARNRYIDVILDRTPQTIEQFLRENGIKELSTDERVTVLKLMELQRYALLMYTSCGWFFDDISGIETVQIIMYAGRVIQLAEALFDHPFEATFLALLERAKSNVADQRDGKHIYEKWIKPAMVDWNQIAAHYGVSALFEEYADRTQIYCYNVTQKDFEIRTAGKAKMVIGKASVTFDITGETEEVSFGVLHFGEHNVNGGVRKFHSDAAYNEVKASLKEAFDRADFAEIIRILDKGFGKSIISLKSLFRDEQRKVLAQLLRPSLLEAEAVYRRMYEDQLPTMRFLSDIGVPLPRVFKTAAAYTIRNDLRTALGEDEPDFTRIQQLLQEAKTWDVELDTSELAYQIRQTLRRMVDRFQEQPTELPPLLTLEQFVSLVSTLPFEVDLWKTQNVCFELLQTIYPELESRALGDETAQAWLQHFVQLCEKLGLQVSGFKKKIAELQKSPTIAGCLDELFTKQRIPLATYRLQFHEHFTFKDALAIVPYLHELGVSDVYASPILKARPHSLHGYDIVDHSMLNPELGTPADFDALCGSLQRSNMGLLLDMVPNHMGIGCNDNHWWNDVLENGPSSIYANYFDVEWKPVNTVLENKVLLPVLEDQYGTVLEQGLLRLCYVAGAFHINYHDLRFPLSPCTYGALLEHVLKDLEEDFGEDDEHIKELKSILTALRYLPSRLDISPESMVERNREKEIIKRRIDTLVSASPAIAKQLARTVEEFNGKLGQASSFDRLDELLAAQAFRPAFWRVAMEDINYRRFFDINDLAAIRVERPDVFRATHQLFFELLAAGKASGLRIDHPDGLWNPTEYFRQLQHSFVVERIKHQLGLEQLPETLDEEIQHRLVAQIGNSELPKWPLYVVAEKILGESEPLPRDWAVHGTTGYDALNIINGIFVDQEGAAAFDAIYQQFLGGVQPFDAVVGASKRMIMLVSLASEINALSHRLDSISERNRRYRDFTLNSLTFAIREVIASLPVYRTYISGADAVSLRDRMYIEAAVEEAKKRNPRTAQAVFNFIRDTLLLQNINDFREEDREELVDWVMRFQQLTGPIMAKGVEDTAFYIYNRLVSLNEVGGHPNLFGIPLDRFHHYNSEKRERWPHSMNAGSTHDVKRSEDVRARLNVLSEIPGEWSHALDRWQGMNADKKITIERRQAPSTNDEYLLYQTLLGALPAEPLTTETMPKFRERIAQYMQKATKEAKVHTSWVNPNAEYDSAVQEFVQRLLPNNLGDPFVQDLVRFQKRIAFFGYWNSLAQLLLRLTIPGVPDIYQGTELWDFSLVDPDNRRPVDYHCRRKTLASLRARIRELGDNLLPLADELMASPEDGRIKMYVLHQMLMFRQKHRRLFNEGEYVPLHAAGIMANHICGFVRTLDGSLMVIAVPRLVVGLTSGAERPPLGSEVWGDTGLVLPRTMIGPSFRNLFTGQVINSSNNGGDVELAAAEMFARFPVFVGFAENSALEMN